MLERLRKYRELRLGRLEDNDGARIFREVLVFSLDNYKNLFNLLRSSIIVNLLVEIEDIANIVFMSPSNIKKLFKVKLINLLDYHPLVLDNIEHKDKIIKILCNKILLACRLGLYGNGKFVDFYQQTIESMNFKGEGEKSKSPKNRKNTIRGGIKKRRRFVNGK